MEPTAITDRAILAGQLGREPRGRIEVEVRCSHGFPQVIRVFPLLDRRPFPTLFWLTCPHLCREVARLEAGGWIHELETRLAQDVRLRERLFAAHRGYIDERRRLLDEATSEDVGLIGIRAREDWRARGIGGIADWNRLKCLHLHVAHSLARGNPIGEVVLDTLASVECSSQNGVCSALM
jgi:hypothetical protein